MAKEKMTAANNQTHGPQLKVMTLLLPRTAHGFMVRVERDRQSERKKEREIERERERVMYAGRSWNSHSLVFPALDRKASIKMFSFCKKVKFLFSLDHAT